MLQHEKQGSDTFMGCFLRYPIIHMRSLLTACLFVPLCSFSQTIDYTLGMPEPWTHHYHVQVSLEGLPTVDSTLEIRLPVWRTGRYVILDFASGVVSFSASEADGESLPWSKVDKTTWRIATHGSARVNVDYTIYADEFALRTRGLNDEHGFVDGSAVFMYVEGVPQSARSS